MDALEHAAEFQRFRNRCVRAHSNHYLCYRLFSDPETLEIWDRVAPMFFRDLKDILFRHVLMEVCALCDLKTSETNDNLEDCCNAAAPAFGEGFQPFPVMGDGDVGDFVKFVRDADAIRRGEVTPEVVWR